MPHAVEVAERLDYKLQDSGFRSWVKPPVVGHRIIYTYSYSLYIFFNCFRFVYIGSNSSRYSNIKKQRTRGLWLCMFMCISLISGMGRSYVFCWEKYSSFHRQWTFFLLMIASLFDVCPYDRTLYIHDLVE